MNHSNNKPILKKKAIISKSTRYRLRKKANEAASTILDTCSSEEENDSIEIKQFNNDETNFIIPDNILVTKCNQNEYNTTYYNEVDDAESNNSNSSIEEEVLNINVVIAEWAIRHRITHQALSDLLKCLRVYPAMKDLPKDARTLLKTPTSAEVKNIKGGIYHHFGIENEVKTLIETEPNLPSELLLVAGIDGLPLTDNPSSQLWPILGFFSNLNKSRPLVFLIGAFLGKTKPHDSNEFLFDFVKELKLFYLHGIVYKEKHITIVLHALICDTPAKSFVLNSKGHTGKNSCTRCITNGIWCNNRTCFPDLESPLRSHDQFISYQDKNFHQGTTLLTEIPKFDMIFSIPYDYMHLVCIGVVKKVILFWVSSKHKHALPSALISVLDNKLNDLGKYIPHEFQRKPNQNTRTHPLRDINRWKATELRQCLLYSGIVVFKNVVSTEVYQNFAVLCVAMRIILSENSTPDYLQYANQLLKHFVMCFIEIYGISYVSHNVHALIHLVDDALKYGPLDKFSSFPFENAMQPLKKDIRSGQKPLQQLINRCAERRVLNVNINKFLKEGPFNAHCLKSVTKPLLSTTSDPQYTGWRFTNYIIKLNFSDNCVEMKNGDIVQIENIATSNIDSNVVIIGRCFEKIDDYFEHPCKSSLLGIKKVSKISTLQFWPILDIKEKLVCLPLDQNGFFLVMPFLHSESS